MSNLQSVVVALAVADLHLSLRCPVARSAEEDWLSSQARSLRQLSKLARKYGNVPVLIAGDLFDRWNEPAETINFALKYLPPNIYAVPGNHDLPYHDYSQLHKTAFYTLVKAGKITLLEPGKPVEIPGAYPLNLHGFPCGYPIKPLKDPFDMYLEIAVVHEYLWIKGSGYEGASEKGEAYKALKRMEGFDTIISGDNHITFTNSGVNWINCGAFIRRKMDEIHNDEPWIGFIYSDGSIGIHDLDTSEDKFIKVDESKEDLTGFDPIELIAQLKSLGDDAINFGEAIRHALEGQVSEQAKRIVLKAMESK